LTINATTGIISGKVSATADNNSPYNVTVSATDGLNTGSASFAWVITTTKTNTLPFSLTDPAWTFLPSGVRTWDVKVGTGATAKAGDKVTVTYTGYLSDGTVFNPTTSSQFTLSSPGLIQGWIDGVPGMKIGGERRLDIPSPLGYGNNPPSGSNIPKNAELVFDITLTAIG
jgi:FKBP-type peptidyl-prolyl cis-trans isomerase